MRGTWSVGLMALCAVATGVSGQTPQRPAAPPAPAVAQRHFTDGVDIRWVPGQPIVNYVLTVAEGDTTGYDVRMSIRGARDTFRIALAKHPEYDDGFFRYVENLRGDARVTLAREDSALWRVIAPGGESVIEYRIALPMETRPRAAWKPFLSKLGGLVGGPHSFMYIVGQELAASHVELRTPWPRIATGLTPTAEPTIYFAPNAYVLVESPIMGGQLSQWSFNAGGVPHHIHYLGRTGGAVFDSTAFATAIEKMATQAVALFGRAPYREYHFMFQDDAWGGLEHHNSVTLGVRSEILRDTPNEEMPEAAHEFVHTWNLIRIRPAEYVGVTHRQIRPVPILWFSEGLTLFYADLLLRRAGIPTGDSTRIRHTEGILSRHVGAPAHSRFSAEQIARVAYNARPDALGDYSGSAHLFGEVIGVMLDLMIRDATDGKRSMDDVMRLLLERASPRGTTGADIERAVTDVCGCPVAPFFAAHVRGTTGKEIDFNRYLGLIGLKGAVAMDTAMYQGSVDVDRRLWAWTPPGDTLLSLLVNNPTTVYARAGLHSGDRLITLNGTSLRTWNELRGVLRRLRIGDDAHFVVQDRRSGITKDVHVKITGYQRPVVTITEVENATPKQIRLREAWLAGR